MKLVAKGFTLVELMITVALAAILAALAIPNFRDLMQRRNVDAVAETLVGDLRFARSEALKRTTPVTVCQSSDSVACTVAPGVWKTGWITFIDFNGNGSVDADDTLLRVQQVPAGIESIQNNPAGDRTFFTFQVTGIAKASNQTFFVTPVNAASANQIRLVCISSPGRASLRTSGSSSCT